MKRLANIPAVAFAADLPSVLVDTAIKGVLLLAIVGLVVFAMRRVSAATLHLFWMSALAGLLLLPVLSLVAPSWRVLPVWLDASAMVRFDSGNKDLPAAVPVSELLPKRELARVSESLEPPSLEPPSSGPQLSERPSTDLSKREAAQKAPAGDLAQLGNGRPFPPTTDEATTKPDTDTAQHDDSRLSLAGLAPVFVAVWVSGVVLLTCRILLSGFALWHLARSSARLTSQRPVELLQQLSAQLGVRQQVRLFSGTRRDMPIVWGIVRPKILLPANWVSWDDARLRAVLLHELAHIRRRDALAQLLVQVACALHWFNPLVWLAAFRVRVEREQACDDLVLNNGVRASDYADHLLSIATGYDHPCHANASAFAMARRFKLEGRIMHVLNRNLNRNALSRRMLAASVATIVSLAVPLAMMQAVATPPVPRDADAREKVNEAGGNAAAKTDPNIAKWISQLGSDKFAIRARATQSLIKAGGKAIPAVIEATQSKDAEVRDRALRILNEAGPNAIPALLGAIQSERAEARNQAFKFLLALSISDDEATANAVRKAAEQLLRSPDRRRVANAKKILDYVESDRKNRENHAKKMLRAKGVSLIKRKGKVVAIDVGNLSRGRLTDEDMVHVKLLTDLQTFSLPVPTTITEVGLAHLKGLKHLERLYLGETEFTDAGLEQIKGLTNLKVLNFGATKVTDAGLKHLKGLKSLHQVGLGGRKGVKSKITDAGLEHLKGLANLRLLSLSLTNVTNLAPIKGMAKLEWLYLGRSNVTDAGLENLKGLPSLQELNLTGTQVTDAGLEHLKGMANLRILTLSRTKNIANLAQMKGMTKLDKLYLSHSTVTDAGLENLKGLPSLRELDLTGTKVTDAGLEHLKELPKLWRLKLIDTQVTGAGLKNLKGVFFLRLNNSTITDAGLEHLKGLTNLRWLYLGGTKVTDAGLKHLIGLPRLIVLNLTSTKVTGPGLDNFKVLEYLTLDNTMVTDAGLEHMKGLTKLKYLSLERTKITDAGLQHLTGLADLRTLKLRQATKITDAGYLMLEKKLPKCSIKR